ncbi:MAG: hypothetical protein RL688_708, partial [Actinomycetota bacterium]
MVGTSPPTATPSPLGTIAKAFA